jgi:hypothetical protein
MFGRFSRRGTTPGGPAQVEFPSVTDLRGLAASKENSDAPLDEKG